ncbi:MAG: zinc-binding dehydrogenase, partial [Anaerolineae bacterium]
TLSQIFQALLLGSLVSKFGPKKMYGVLARPDPNDLAYMKDLIEAGKVTPVIDRCYPLAETAEAIRYVDAGHARGKVIITMV